MSLAYVLRKENRLDESEAAAREAVGLNPQSESPSSYPTNGKLSSGWFVPRRLRATQILDSTTEQIEKWLDWTLTTDDRKDGSEDRMPEDSGFSPRTGV